MTAARRRQPSRSFARSIVLGFLVAACGSTIDPIPSSAPTPTPPKMTAIPSSGPFVKIAYPTTGDAPCGQAAAPDPSHGAYAGNLKRISSTNARTVVFALCEPDVAFLSKIAAPAFSINDSGWLTSHIDPAATGPQAIVTEVNGTGPYRLESWKPGAEVSLARDPAYWGAAAKNERLIVRWTADAAQRTKELGDGTVDGIDAVDPASVAAMTDNVALTVLPRPGLNVVYLGFDNTVAPFSDERVRQALAIGLDRQAIIDTAFPPGTLLASHYTPCTIPHGCAGTRWYDNDPTLAKEMLSGAGFPSGFDTTIHYADAAHPFLPDPAGVATALRDALLSDLGIRATIVPEPEATYLADVAAGKTAGLLILGQTATYPDVTSYVDARVGAGASAGLGKKFPDLVRALAGGATPDAAKREAAYARANGLIRTHVPMIPIADVGSTAAFRADVAGALVSPLGLERFASMTPGDRRQLVWLTTAEPAGLYCADESDPVASLLCAQLMDTLYAYDPTSSGTVPSLAQRCDPNAASTVWTCTIRPGVLFDDGSLLDANDVVLTFAVQWDAAHPLHHGREGTFPTFRSSFGGFLNPSPAPGG
ncbi:MAG: peptide/nickel transport system substrate-binding protein [Chloroflexota bacterium]|nr:peptide/nickel transport system substrate-binding protein [Chloroflexota bacterium]